MKGHWDWVRSLPTVVEEIPKGSKGVHESLLRAYHILEEVKGMLARGDSPETVSGFIEWCEAKPTHTTWRCRCGRLAHHYDSRDETAWTAPCAFCGDSHGPVPEWVAERTVEDHERAITEMRAAKKRAES